MYQKLLCLILTGCFSALAWSQDMSTPRPVRQKAAPGNAAPAADDKLFTKWIINVGSHTEFVNEIQTDASGGTKSFEFSPTVGLGFFVPINAEFTFLPEVNWVLPRTDPDAETLENTLMLRADWGYNPVDFFRVRVGTSIMWLNQHGKGGSTKMNNGNTTSTFYNPDENRSSFNNTLDVGAEALFGEWAVRLQTYTYAVFKEERRKVSYTLFLSYYWDR